MKDSLAAIHPLRNHRILFYGCWLVLGLIQASFTELQDDEAYYWLYGQYLDWGYFDHPPMIGLLVKAGYTIIPNELGVRFFPLLLNLLSLLIIEKLIEKKDPFLFYAISLSIAVLQLTGFIAVPDIPLIFFTALYFLCYKRFTASFTMLNAIALGLAIALLFYSKYHAVLVVFFSLLARPSLFLRPQLYLAGLVALILFIPHLWWQYQHDWVSFRYHLFESNVNAYKVSFTADYLVGQILLPGPLAGFILLPAALLYKPKTETEKALRFSMIGIYLFFLLSSFRGRVEANWTSPVLVPLMVLAHQFLYERNKWRRWLLKLLPVTLVLVVFARIVMITDLLPIKEIQKRYHSWKHWPTEMKTLTQGMPVVFSNSYQRASKYWFYSGQMTYSQNDYHERRNNFNFWPVEDSLLGKPVYFLDIYRLERFPHFLSTRIGKVGYRFDSALYSFAKLQFVLPSGNLAELPGKMITLNGRVDMPVHYKQYLAQHSIEEDTIRIAIFSKTKWLKDVITPLRLNKLAENPTFQIHFNSGLPPDKYFIRFSINVGGYNGTHNSSRIALLVK